MQLSLPLPTPPKVTITQEPETDSRSEYQNNVLRRFRPQQILLNFYQVFLGRGLDSTASVGINMIRQGRSRDVLDGIVNSPEFRQQWAL